LFVELSAHAELLVTAAARGTLTNAEALAALQRHAQGFREVLAALESETRS